uniref:Plastid light harvesting protein n=1 Tax=Aureoumbra lagunensis TaxID=44058 RepID=A0A6S8DIV7_9STRA|mmetsp:Transcript_21011/g.25264  ORF Transcript_21011/g.25264 Transcript_21011/m.25264 type:complete len:197 (+) Transcript_21011:150-740(+)|eukprot:CAMPEP_0197288336 /NCGR_PEP_ID=MMETSP0890-20130614/5362_1 /TAXON_ID=44058 ORGANISM="Aureoumbra lagunensis, Strain CCMP1510" /NCGR_SAMPLE_ID=MMETSP0890 /ASSEMBLY_ACC=CAM_ASM_000533 /LENGTH=196 /DNA_ID=CAMNT_0042758971 /DNA_START=136 /DNA_END=726 /DNA_ORIENTATION=+
MYKLIVALCLTTAAAFQAPVTSTRASTSMKAAEDLPGVIAPTGFFDPLSLSSGLSPARLKYYREAELKHGRVAMLAALGFLVGENFHPLFGGDIDVPSYIAFQATPLENFWPIVIAAVGWFEYINIEKFNVPGEGFWTLKPEYENGDLGFDPLGLKPTDAAELSELQTKELQNGRLAMLGIAGMVAQELTTGGKLF